ncbi:MAG: WYL domain-containing protein [Candidatus Omnitrophica bacterium]|nr:WYL domain-containing protein [Candidatus Omnitrophota bacterium]
MHRNLDEVEFVIFDTETTGLSPESGDRIVELAAVRVKGAERLGVFQSLVNPGRAISQAAFQVNHISSEMLFNAPTIETVMPKFIDFIQGACICSYNAAFDLAFLNNELKLIGRELPCGTAVVDALKMARRLLPSLERYALWFVSEKLGVKTAQEHRALSDVELTLKVFNILKKSLKEKEIFDFSNFLSLFSLPSGKLDDINNQKISKIQEAINLKVKLKIKYLAASNAQVSEREVLPREIRQERNIFYLVGHCYLRNEERSFRIDGILALETL